MRTFWSPGQKPKLITSCEYASRSYDACSVSSAKGVVTGIPNGSALVSTSIPRLASSAKKRSWKAATERPSASGKESTSPRLERAKDGVLSGRAVRRGRAVWGGVTTADVPGGKTEAQMDPPAADAQTVLAARDALGERRHLNRVEMRADVRHSFSSPSGKSARRSSARSKEPRYERPSTKIVGVPVAPLARALDRSASTRSR